MPGLFVRIIFSVFICWFPNMSNCNTWTWCLDFAVNVILLFRIDGSDRGSNFYAETKFMAGIVVVVERKIEIFRVAFIADGSIRPEVTFPWIRK